MIDAVGGCVWKPEEEPDASGSAVGPDAPKSVAPESRLAPPRPAEIDSFAQAPESSPDRSGLSLRFDPQEGAAAVALRTGPVSAQVSAVGLVSNSAAIDASVKLQVDAGRFDAGVRQVVTGHLSGTTLARVGYASHERDSGLVAGSFHAAVGVASLPDLRRRLIPSDHDPLGYATAASDASITAAVLAGGGEVRLHPLQLADGVHLDGKAAAEAVFFAPIERDPATARRISNANNGFTSFDEGASLGLSRLSVDARAGLSVDEGALHARVEASARSNVMDDPTFALKSGAPLAAIANYAFTERALDGSVGLKDGTLTVRGHLPLATTRGDEPMVGVEARLKQLSARAALELGEQPTVSLSAALPLSPGATLGVQGRTDFHGDNSAQVSLSIAFGGRGPKLPSAVPDPQRPSGPPRSRDFWELPPGIGTMSFEQTMNALDTPEKVAAFLNPANREAGGLAYLPHNDDWSKWTTQETFAHRGGICADLHLFGAAALQRHGIEAYDVQFMARTLAHDVIAYRDRSGSWNVLQYGQILETEATDPISAVQRAFPDAMQFQVVDPRSMQTVEAGKASWAEPITDYFGR